MKTSKNTFVPALKMILYFTLLTGLIYPLFITGLAQVFFPFKANGSLVKRDGRVIGSELFGQLTTDSAYFWPRPSATDYGTMAASGSNLGPTSADLSKKEEERRTAFIAANHLDNKTDVPVEMLFASGSGIDPHISQQSALLQVNRIAAYRKLNAEKSRELRSLVIKCTEQPQFSVLGAQRVNVLLLNLEVDKLIKQ